MRVTESTFNCVTVDGDTSTNDTCLLLANGAAGGSRITAGSSGAVAFEMRCSGCATSLAEQLVADAEGATRHFRVAVDGALNENDARVAARVVAQSPLVKTAIHGGDPNWGRIVAALGRSGATFTLDRCRVAIGGVVVFDRGAPAPVDHDPRPRRAVASARRHRHRPRGRCGERPRLGLRPLARVRSHQRRLHHLTRRGTRQTNMPEQTIDERIQRAQVLIEALPYIKRFAGHILVVKVGGAASAAADLDAVLEDIVLLRFVGMRPVIVHGGGSEISAWQQRVGLEPRFVNGLRVTDAPTMEIAKMVLTGKVGPDIVARIHTPRRAARSGSPVRTVRRCWSGRAPAPTVPSSDSSATWRRSTASRCWRSSTRVASR